MHMRLRVVILIVTLLAVAAVVVACASGAHAGQSTSAQASTGSSAQPGEIFAERQGTKGATTSVATAGTKPVPTSGATASTKPIPTSVVTAATTLTTLSVAVGKLPTIAPLNPAFLDSLRLPAIDMSSIAAVGYPLGVRPTSQDFLSVRGIQVPSLGGLELPSLGTDHAAPGVIPATYDLRTLGRVTSVKDQNPYGTCWSFASLGSLESCLLPGETWDFSEDNMVLTSGFDYPRRPLRLRAATSGCPPPTWSAGAAPSTRATTPTGTATRRPA